MNKNIIAVMSTVVLLATSCSKEKMMKVDFPYNTPKYEKPQSTSSSKVSHDQWTDIGPIDKRVAALNVVLYERIHFKISLDKNGNYTGGDDFIALKSEGGRWLIHFEEKDFLEGNGVQVLKLSCSHEKLDNYIFEKSKKHPKYKEYKKLQKLSSKGLLSNDWDKMKLKDLRKEIFFLNIDYDRFGSDLLNGLPIILETKDLN